MANKHTLSDLYQMQSLPLSAKIRMTQRRINDWVDEFGEDGVYVSFSGGKDSTVLLDIVRNVCGFKNVPAVFVDVPTQYPELKEFVQTFENVEIIKPKISFMEVCEKYGFPLISKEVSESVQGARKYLTQILEQESLKQASKQASYDTNTITKKSQEQENTINFLNPSLVSIIVQMLILLGGGTIESIAESEELANLLNKRYHNKMGGNNQRLAIMLGMLGKDGQIKANIPSKDRSQFSQEKYKFFLEAPFEISNRCCSVMKKEPAHKYHKMTGRNPITATMASESKLRTQKWLQNGCNGFKLTIPTSNPMSFWTEQDVLLYIKEKNLQICSVYGDVVVDYEAEGNVEGQMNMSELSPDLGLFDCGNRPLKTTGCDRTGCVLCGFGCHLEKPDESRFLRLKETHPGLHSLLYKIENNGITYAETIDWINEHGGFDIKY